MLSKIKRKVTNPLKKESKETDAANLEEANFENKAHRVRSGTYSKHDTGSITRDRGKSALDEMLEKENADRK